MTTSLQPLLYSAEGHSQEARDQDEFNNCTDNPDASSLSSTNNFQYFPDLPSELRLHVWEEAAKYKRNIVIRAPYRSRREYLKWQFNMMFTKTRGGHRLGWTTRTPPPALLSVNHEARQVALKAWDLAFGFSHIEPSIYINFDRDDLIIPPSETRHARAWRVCVLAKVWHATPDMDRVQRIIVLGENRLMVTTMDMQRIGAGFLKSLKTMTHLRIDGTPTPSGDWRHRMLHIFAKDSRNEDREYDYLPLRPFLQKDDQLLVVEDPNETRPSQFQVLKMLTLKLADIEDTWEPDWSVRNGVVPKESSSTKHNYTWFGVKKPWCKLTDTEYYSQGRLCFDV